MKYSWDIKCLRRKTDKNYIAMSFFSLAKVETG